MKLSSDRLNISVDNPGSSYRGPRFDWTGICLQVVLDDKHTFCATESCDDYKGTKGIGLSGEFGIATPVGYDDVPVNDTFPKIGVGLLKRRHTGKYSHMEEYEFSPHSIEIEAAGSSMVFKMHNFSHAGFGWDYTKTLTVKDNALTIAYALVNKGSQPIRTEEYCHNFMCIDNRTMSPDYTFTSSFPLNTTVKPEFMTIEGNRLTFPAVLAKTQYFRVDDLPAQDEHQWELSHKTAGASVTVREIFPVNRFALWTMPHVISPECFIALNIAPGEAQEWQREYTFAC